MAHIHTKPGQHDHTVSFFIIRTDGSEPRLLLHKHKKTGRLSMFGGHIELNETPWQAALHEISEETGYLHEQLSILQPAHRILKLKDAAVHPSPVVSSTGLYPQDVVHYHSDTMYALVASESPAGQPDEGESTTMILVTLDELRDLPKDSIFEAWREVGEYILTEVYNYWGEYPLSDFDA